MPKQEKEAFDRYYYCKKTGKINSTSSMKTVVIDLTLSSDEEDMQYIQCNVCNILNVIHLIVSYSTLLRYSDSKS